MGVIFLSNFFILQMTKKCQKFCCRNFQFLSKFFAITKVFFIKVQKISPKKMKTKTIFQKKYKNFFHIKNSDKSRMTNILKNL